MIDTIQKFTDLITWKEGHKLVLQIYKETSYFPSKETYSLVDQIRRAVVSITSNIAEGFSRNSYKEKCQFYYMALSSLTEVQNQLIIAKDIKYLSLDIYMNINTQTIIVHKLLNSLIKATKLKKYA